MSTKSLKMPFIHIDAAIIDPKHDRFGRNVYAKYIAQAILVAHNDLSVTFAIEGRWGSGKTSIINMVEYELIESYKEKVTVIRFSAWLISQNKGDLIQEFMKILENSVSSSQKNAKLRGYAAALFKSKLLGKAACLIDYTQLLKSTLDDAAKLLEIVPSLYEEKEKVVKELEAYTKSVVVIIDDLDRLWPKEVYTVLSLVKNVADFPKVNYLIAWDRAHITKSLEKLNIPNPTEYLEKFVQICLPVPHLRNLDFQNIFNIFKEQIILEKEEEMEVEEFYTDFASKMLITPRDIYRFHNHLNFYLFTLRSEIALVDLMGVSLIQTKFPEYLEFIKYKWQAFYDGDYLSTDDHRPYRSIQDVAKAFSTMSDKYLKEITKDEKIQFERLIVYIFPKSPSFFEISTDYKRRRNDKSIAIKEENIQKVLMLVSPSKNAEKQGEELERI